MMIQFLRDRLVDETGKLVMGKFPWKIYERL